MTKEKTTRVAQLAGYLSTYKDFSHMHPKKLVPLAEHCLEGIDKITSDTLETVQSRDEEIKKAADERWSDDYSHEDGFCSDPGEYQGFLKGAKWADAHPRPEKLEKDEALREARIAMQELFIDEDGDSWKCREWLSKFGELVNGSKDG